MTADSSKSVATGGQSDTPTRKGRGTVEIDNERCKGCGYCVAFCPQAVLALSTEFNAKGYHFPVVVHPEKCTGCNLCGMYCPDFAIYGQRLKS